MPTDFSVNNNAAVSFLVSAGIVYEIIAANCSSPQTTEINVTTRGNTLMKWVNLGIAQAAIFVAVAVYLDKRRWPPILGGVMAATFMYASYIYGKNSGLKSQKMGTETN